ncbi:MAG: MFS transporter, partial [Candidatus Dormibacteraceae bacterium]
MARLGPETERPGGDRRLWRAIARHQLDLAPLRSSRDFRLLFLSRVTIYLGTQAAEVALLVQAKQLTGSPLVVGLLGAVEIVPLVVFGLYGGHLADRWDRKRLALICEAGLLVCAAGLTANALLPRPSVAVLFVAAGLTMALSSLQRPSIEAAIPRLVAREQLAAAAVLISVGSNAAAIVGPAVGGALASYPGPAIIFGVDTLTFAISMVLLGRLSPLPPPAPQGDRPLGGLRGVAEGFGYVATHPELLGSYLVDWMAMVLGYAVPLYPFMAGL